MNAGTLGGQGPLAVAPFKNDPEEWQRLDWQLLQNSSVILYFSPSVLERDTAWFENHDYRVLSLDTGPCSSSEDLLVALAGLLSFPHYFGRNLNAFDDCLSDVEMPEEGGLVLVLRNFHAFAKAFPAAAHALLDISASNTRRFLLTGRRFLVLVHSADPRLTFEPVGSTAVTWNPQEWLDSKRGL
jgi:RNAse (barnase) inhibitor barstar